MHPPFGFALFYLRSVAPKEVKTSDIYWGAIPFVCIQVIMVALVIIFPGMVLHAIHKSTVDPASIEFQVPHTDFTTPESGTPQDDEKPDSDEEKPK
jgi:hypothetical protein